MTPRARDRRVAKRYAVALPVDLTPGRAVTRDVSETGIYFETSQPLAAGATLRFILTLGQNDPDGRFRVECEGRIVRVEHRGPTLGVAAHIVSYRLERDPLTEPVAAGSAVPSTRSTNP
jgi:hypothetical protein